MEATLEKYSENHKPDAMFKYVSIHRAALVALGWICEAVCYINPT